MSAPRHLVTALASLALVTAAACGGDKPKTESPEAPAATPETPATSAPSAAPSASASADASAAPKAPPPPPTPSPTLVYKGLATPESVLYDAAADRYLVSNVNGKPLDADGNGFISVLAPDGKVTTLKWIEGGAKAKLDAPKGLAIAKGVLYVADIDKVRMFDAKTGAPKGDIALEGATFANDVAAGPDGKIYVSDSGMKAGGKDFEPTGTDAVWVIQGGKATALAKSKDLGRPNGLLVTGKGLLANTFGAAEVYRLDAKGAKQDVTKLPNGGLDGLQEVGDQLLVSSWGASAIYRGKLGGTFEAVVQNVSGPADFAWDSKRKRIVLPRFLDDSVEVYEIK